MPEQAAHPAAWEPDRLLADCSLRRLRRSGPGGQHRNKVETAVVITHRPTTLQGSASERRSQQQNRQVALFRLRKKLALYVRLPRSTPSAPSPLWRSRCRGGRLAISDEHDDFPALLAEALDFLEGFGQDCGQAAAALQVTPSQLIKFLKLEPAAMQQTNQRRRELGLHPLQ